MATIIGDYGLVGDFGTRFAALNHGIFGYVAYLYMPFLLYPAYRLYKSHALTFRRLELCVSFSLFFVALLIFQSLALAQGSFGNALVGFLKNYIGYFGVWVLDIFFFLFSWLISTERNIDQLLKKLQNKLLVAFDFIKHIALASFYALKLFLSRAYHASVPKLKALFTPKTQDVLDLQNSQREQTLNAAYDFKDVMVDTPFDELNPAQQMSESSPSTHTLPTPDSEQFLESSATFSTHTSQNPASSSPASHATPSHTTLNHASTPHFSESSSTSSSLAPSNPTPPPAPAPAQGTQEPTLSPASPTPSPTRGIELVQRSESDMGLEEFLKSQVIKHRDMLNNLRQHTAISEPIFQPHQEITPAPTKPSPAQSPESAPAQKREIETPPPRPLNPDVFLQPTPPKPSTPPPHSQVREQNLQAAKAPAQDTALSTITQVLRPASFAPTECDDNLQAQMPQFQEIQPLSRLHDSGMDSGANHSLNGKPQAHPMTESRSESNPAAESRATSESRLISESSPTPQPQAQKPAQILNSHTPQTPQVPSPQSTPAQTHISESTPLATPLSTPSAAPQPQPFEVQITEIPASPAPQNMSEEKHWADSIIEEIPSPEAQSQSTPKPQSSFAMPPLNDFDDDDDDAPAHKVLRVTELEENRAFLDGLEYGKVAKPLNFKLPSTSLLNQHFDEKVEIDESEVDRKIEDLLAKLKMFRVEGDIARTYSGPIVTTFEFRPAPNVKVSKILTLEDDLAMALRARSIRIQAPIPGKDVVGIEIPNNTMQTIYLREVLESDLFKTSTSPLTLALGKDIVGSAFITDLKRLPHLLIAGTTGSGKSVGINAMILSLLFKNSPDQLKLLMIDPKKVEFSAYADIPHLITPIITQPKKAIVGLNSAMAEMERRYDLMSEARAKDIDTYNRKIAAEGGEKFPYLVIVIDELADLMMTGGKEVEFALARIAQMGRASGIHIIVATQRPSVDVVTGLIKTNLPSRISYKVGSKIDSKVILDTFGAESLLGRGDMLFTPPGVGGVTRLHAPWNSEEEIERVVEFIKSQRAVEYDKSFMLDERDSLASESADGSSGEGGDLIAEAKSIILQDRKTSASYLQRRLSIGYNKAANLIEQLEKEGFLSAPNIKGVREILE